MAITALNNLIERQLPANVIKGEGVRMRTRVFAMVGKFRGIQVILAKFGQMTLGEMVRLKGDK